MKMSVNRQLIHEGIRQKSLSEISLVLTVQPLKTYCGRARESRVV